MTCPATSGFFFFNVTVRLRNGTTIQRRHDESLWDTYMESWTNEPQNTDFQLTFAANTPAIAYSRMNEIVPRAVAKFGVSRTALNTYSDDVTSGSTSSYSVNADRLTLRQTRMYGQDGIFTVAHEYGHAFHAGALQGVLTACGAHSFFSNSGEACAYTEGWADMFGAWIANDQFTSSGFSDSFMTDYAAETNPWRGLGGDVEGAFASYVYDLLDGQGELDDASNSSKLFESNDQLTLAGSDLTYIMANCSIGFTYDGDPDQVVYRRRITTSRDFIMCVENSVSMNAEGYFPSVGVTYRDVIGGMWWQNVLGTSKVLWHWNLFNT